MLRFEFRLAFLLGMTVRQLRENIEDTRELAGWMAYLQLEPPLQESWHQAAMLALNARRIAGDKRAKLKDFLPQPPRPKVESPQGMLDKMRAMFGGKPPPPSLQGDDDEE